MPIIDPTKITPEVAQKYLLQSNAFINVAKPMKVWTGSEWGLVDVSG